MSKLKICPECRDYLKAYRQAVALGKTVFIQAQDTVRAVPKGRITAILGTRFADSDDTNGETS